MTSHNFKQFLNPVTPLVTLLITKAFYCHHKILYPPPDRAVIFERSLMVIIFQDKIGRSFEQRWRRSHQVCFDPRESERQTLSRTTIEGKIMHLNLVITNKVMKITGCQGLGQQSMRSLVILNFITLLFAKKITNSKLSTESPRIINVNKPSCDTRF